MLENNAASKIPVLRTEPRSIDFGNLGPGEGGSVTLNVYGGPGKVSVRSDQLKVSPTQWQEGQNNLEITLLGGSSGELIWDELILQSDNQELTVPVTARWTARIVETPITETIAPQIMSQPQKARTASKEERTFKGKSCSLCGRNFGYNIDSGSWEQCTCSWYQKVRNISLHTYKELRYGAKDIPSYLQELWRVLLGKEKW